MHLKVFTQLLKKTRKNVNFGFTEANIPFTNTKYSLQELYIDVQQYRQFVGTTNEQLLDKKRT